jgi:hypothetical protein
MDEIEKARVMYALRALTVIALSHGLSQSTLGRELNADEFVARVDELATALIGKIGPPPP